MHAKMKRKFSLFSSGQIVKVLEENNDAGTVVIQAHSDILEIDIDLVNLCVGYARLSSPVAGKPVGTNIILFYEGVDLVGYGLDGVELTRDPA
jgi:hypothetical protein